MKASATRHRVQLLVLVLFATTLLVLAKNSHSEPRSHDRSETAFIYQFTRYIQWPELSSEYFTITVIGDSPIYSELLKLSRVKTAHGRKLRILQGAVSRIEPSEIIVLTTNSESDLAALAQATKAQNTLIVSHADGFARKGSMINFFTDQGRLRFEINRSALAAQKLEVSSRLLQLARIADTRSSQP